jgi:hypothetical protein
VWKSGPGRRLLSDEGNASVISADTGTVSNVKIDLGRLKRGLHPDPTTGMFIRMH